MKTKFDIIEQIRSLKLVDSFYSMIHIDELFSTYPLEYRRLIFPSLYRKTFGQSSITSFHFHSMNFEQIEWFLFFKPEELIESFQTHFWLIEKQWFVRCDYQATNSQTYLYTIPCIQNQLTYSHPWKQLPRRQINEISNIHQLNLSSKLSYEQLSRSINLSSIQHFIFGSNISTKFFSEIIKYHHQHVSIEISCEYLNRILDDNPNLFDYLQQIKSLKLECKLNRMKNICFYFSNLEQIILTGLIDSSELLYCLNNLKHLTFLMVNTCCFQFIDNLNKEKWLFNRCQSHLMNKNILCKWYLNTLYIFME